MEDVANDGDDDGEEDGDDDHLLHVGGGLEAPEPVVLAQKNGPFCIRHLVQPQKPTWESSK